MSDADCFFDSNILLYLLSGRAERADRVETLLADGGTVSVQVLNEFADVATHKFRRNWREVGEMLDIVCRVCTVEALSLQTHRAARELAARHRFRIYDATIIAAAQLAGCRTLYSEDLQSGQRFGPRLTVRNPFEV